VRERKDEKREREEEEGEGETMCLIRVCLFIYPVIHQRKGKGVEKQWGTKGDKV
jgi:hypothetical protein